VASIQFRVQLDDIQPAIWRSFQLDMEESFFDLHEIIQIVMGWENAHLFEFAIQGRKIGLLPEEEDIVGLGEDVEDSELVFLSDFELNIGDKIRYHYDFGDSWMHTLTVEKILTEDTETPLCLNGARACPPEDIGGVPGYLDFLAILADPKHPDHEEFQDWVEEFDAEAFDLAEANKDLEEYDEWRQDLFADDEEE
jgi:Plasmid pRiA4b ORF-3-like protein